MSDPFRALADESRRLLLDRLFAENGQSLVKLCDGLAMSRQAVSKHLAILEAANLIAVRKSGREKRHYLNPVPLAKIVRRWIGKFEDVRLVALLDTEAKPPIKRPSAPSRRRRLPASVR
ncbi:ArsR/SmtB family transcription factor [Sphingobium boeckii]|uniref:DNA-binding transcriptional ArsR family regulator n=1 Tax=Sphingobium boeckii TaxID=1082345 RepID=A0A7W9AIG1_9SPHN|nr:metalloregulator ArsR/SmtB family transcription factor [Sphingobium boeckii]MBB5686260.1 DNA-binding transcriptional ArsR family regulator [Sphingobium boeckii]